MSLQDRLLRATRSPVVGSVAYFCLKMLGVEFPRAVVRGENIELAHGASGLVLHRSAVLGSRITLMPGVLIGRADSWIHPDHVAHLGGHVTVGDDVTLGAGAKILFAAGQDLVIAPGTIVGANAVLRKSTGPYEIWAGTPARCVGVRDLEKERALAAGALSPEMLAEDLSTEELIEEIAVAADLPVEVVVAQLAEPTAAELVEPAAAELVGDPMVADGAGVGALAAEPALELLDPLPVDTAPTPVVHLPTAEQRMRSAAS